MFINKLSYQYKFALKIICCIWILNFHLPFFVLNTGPFQPSYEMMLKFYAFYKQGTEGKCTKPKPWAWDIVSKKKWFVLFALMKWSQIEKQILLKTDIFFKFNLFGSYNLDQFVEYIIHLLAMSERFQIGISPAIWRGVKMHPLIPKMKMHWNVLLNWKCSP